MPALILFLLLTGCTLSPAARVEEATWQLLHTIDVGQTVQIAKNPNCYSESNAFIGPHPTVTTVIWYGLGTSVLHYMLTDWLGEKLADHPWVQHLWFAESAFITGKDVYTNSHDGLHFGSAECP
jgi:hypothetical protein